MLIMSLAERLNPLNIDTQWVKENNMQLQKVFEIISAVEKHTVALITSKSEKREVHQKVSEVQQQLEMGARQYDNLHSDIEHVAKQRLQCQVKQQEVNSEKTVLEARNAAFMQDLAIVNDKKEKLKADTKQMWEKLVYAAMLYKLRLSCHISLNKQNEHLLTLEFFQTERSKKSLYFINLSHDQDGIWALLDMHPHLAHFDRLCEHLEKSQDIQRLVVYLHHKFADLRNNLLC